MTSDRMKGSNNGWNCVSADNNRTDPKPEFKNLKTKDLRNRRLETAPRLERLVGIVRKSRANSAQFTHANWQPGAPLIFAVVTTIVQESTSRDSNSREHPGV
jgi:hypothetical protein